MSTLNPNWTKVAVYQNRIKAEIVKQMLIENQIPAVIMNRQDSSYLFGAVELYVSNEYELEAYSLIDSFEDLDHKDED